MDETYVEKLSEMDRKLDMRFAAVDARFAVMDTRFERVEANFPTFEQRIDEKFARFEMRMYKALFVLWTATVVPLAALLLALDGVFQR